MSLLLLSDDVCCCCLSLLSRCSRKHQCQRHLQPNHWLWSFEPTNQCVTVQSLQPANQSKDEQTQVGCTEGDVTSLVTDTQDCFWLTKCFEASSGNRDRDCESFKMFLTAASCVYVSVSKVTLSVIQLPALTEAESLSCVFGLLPPQPAIVTGTSITCQSPAPELLPLMPTGSGEYRRQRFSTRTCFKIYC